MGKGRQDGIGALQGGLGVVLWLWGCIVYECMQMESLCAWSAPSAARNTIRSAARQMPLSVQSTADAVLAHT